MGVEVASGASVDVGIFTKVGGPGAGLVEVGEGFGIEVGEGLEVEVGRAVRIPERSAVGTGVGNGAKDPVIIPAHANKIMHEKPSNNTMPSVSSLLFWVAIFAKRKRKSR